MRSVGLCLVLLLIGLAPAATAQPRDLLGIGGQVGDPTGITVRLPSTQRYALDFLAAWDLDETFFFNAHAQYYESVPESPKIRYYYGPGAFIGIEDRGDTELLLGVSGRFGVNVWLEPFEVYLQITPRFSIIEATRFNVGAGLGLRYFFRRGGRV